MPFITQSSIQEVIDKMDAVAVINDYVRLEKRSGRFMGLCPFHNEKTPSFTVNPDLKLYHCFGCGKGGTVLNFVMEMDKISFLEAIVTMAKRFGVELIYENSGNGKNEKKESQTEAIFDLYARVANSFHYWLMETSEGKPVLDYLSGRGISREMMEKFRLGYAPSNRQWLFAFLSQKGYSGEFLASSTLFSQKHLKTSFFSHRLMFPINNHQGRTVAFGARLLDGEGPKYINSAESEIYKKGQTLFAIDLAIPEIRKKKEAFIAEGYMDVIALHQAGITNAVAPLGTAFTDEQARLLRRFADSITIMFDQDEAGQTATVKAILKCRQNGLIANVVTPTIEIKDPADILKGFGKETLTNCVKCVTIDVDYLVIRSKALFDTSSSEGKSKAAAFMFPYLETLDSEVSRDSVIGRLADALRVDREAVRDDYNRRYTPTKSMGKSDESQNAPPLRMNDELFLLAVVSVNDDLYPKFRSLLSIKEIEDPDAKDLFIALEDCFVHDETGLDALLPRIRSDNVRKFIIKRGASDEFSDPEQLISDGIKRIKQRRIERRLANIVTELHLIENVKDDPNNINRDGSRLEELLREKMHIDAELRRLKQGMN
jgi:DNA primase